MTTKKKPAPKKRSPKKSPTRPQGSATAQSAPALGLAEADLNDREKRVLAFLRKADAPQTALEITVAVFPGVRPRTRGKSQSRNSLRRLVREGFARQVGGSKAASGLRMPGEGTYAATAKGATKKVAKRPTIAKEAASDAVAAE